jgi:hypothetical protein
MAKKAGRPTSEPQTHLLQMRISAAFLEKLDRWRGRQFDVPSKTEAIRRLVERGLAADEMPAFASKFEPERPKPSPKRSPKK